MDHIKQLLNRRVKQSGLSNQVVTALIIEEFKKMVKDKLGETASKKIKPLYLKNKVLTVVCLSSVVAQEINFYKQALITEINDKNGHNTIQNIRFVL